MTTQTSHRTFNKTMKREIASMFPDAKTFKKVTEDYRPIVLIYGKEKNIIARIEKSYKNGFIGLIIIPHQANK